MNRPLENNTGHDTLMGKNEVQNMRDDDTAFVEQARQSLDRGCEAVDGYTQSRLTAIRHEALGRNKAAGLSRWLPATGVVTACTVLVVFTMLSNTWSGEDAELVGDDALQDIDLLTAEEGIEFFEDYEFYQWLAANSPPA